MSTEQRAAFFDGIAAQWDGWHDLAAIQATLAVGLAELGVGATETVVDAGCGTGNLTAALAARLGPGGRILAVDVSPRMLDVARGKVRDPRVTWRLAGAEALPVEDGSVDRVFFMAVWPHFDEPERAGCEAFRALRPGGRVHVWHLAGREYVNSIHASGNEPIRGDLLVPAGETAATLERAGFEVVGAVVDDGERYLVSAAKPG